MKSLCSVAPGSQTIFVKHCCLGTMKLKKKKHIGLGNHRYYFYTSLGYGVLPQKRHVLTILSIKQFTLFLPSQCNALHPTEHINIVTRSQFMPKQRKLITKFIRGNSIFYKECLCFCVYVTLLALCSGRSWKEVTG